MAILGSPYTEPAREPNEVLAAEGNLELSREAGFNIVSPCGQVEKPNLPSLRFVIGVHKNELPSCLRDGQFNLTDDVPPQFVNCHLEALNQLIDEYSSRGGLPFNIKLIVDIFDDLHTDSTRDFHMPGYKKDMVDPNRLTSAVDEALVEAQRDGVEIDYAFNILPHNNALADPSLEAVYRLIDQRIRDLGLFLMTTSPNAVVILTHADKDTYRALGDISPTSYAYNYFHSLSFHPKQLEPLTHQYIESLQATRVYQSGRLSIASQAYIIDENATVPQSHWHNVAADGAYYLCDPPRDGSIESFLALLGMPAVLSNELQDGLELDEQIEVIKCFYSSVLIPLAHMISKPIQKLH